MTPSRLLLHGLLVSIGTIVILWAANLLCTARNSCCAKRVKKGDRQEKDVIVPRDRKPRPPSAPRTKEDTQQPTTTAEDAPSKSLWVIGMNQCGACQQLKAHFAEKNIKHTFVDIAQGAKALEKIPKAIMEQEDVLKQGVPALFVLDHAGKVVDSTNGFSPQLTKEDSFLDKHGLR